MSTPPAFWRSPLGWLCAALITVAAGFAASGHAAHVLGVLAWLAILACPLLHVFLHHRHGRHARDDAAPTARGA